MREREINVKICFKICGICNELENIDVEIIDKGDGFDLTDKDYPTFGRFGKWFDDTKGQNNKGCGRAQFFHYFNEVEIISKGFNNDKNFTRIHWQVTKEKDLQNIIDEIKDIPSEITIHLINYIDDKNKFYEKIADLNKLKKEIITNCFLKLLNKNVKIILERKENGKTEQQITTTTKDLDEYTKNSI